MVCDRLFDKIDELSGHMDTVRSVAERVFVDGCRCELEEVSYRPPIVLILSR